MFRFLSVLFLLPLLISCTPRITSNFTLKLPELPVSSPVEVLDISDKVPDGACLLGDVNIGDTGFTTDCNLQTVTELAKAEVRKAGGNAFKITRISTPDIVSSCYRIRGLAYKIKVDTTAESILLTDSKIPIPEADTIRYKKIRGGYAYDFQRKDLTMATFSTVVRNCPEAYRLYQQVKSNIGLVSVLSYAGGFLIGYPLGTMLGGGKPVWAMAAVGCGFLAIALPVAIHSDKVLLKAAMIYNNSVMRPAVKNEMSLTGGFTSQGVGLVLRF